MQKDTKDLIKSLKTVTKADAEIKLKEKGLRYIEARSVALPRVTEM